MGQKSFFDVERRLEVISAKGDPLETIKKVVPWEDFRADIEAVTETKPEERKSNAGRKPYDAILKGAKPEGELETRPVFRRGDSKPQGGSGSRAIVAAHGGSSIGPGTPQIQDRPEWGAAVSGIGPHS